MRASVRFAALAMANLVLPRFPSSLPVILAFHALPEPRAFGRQLDRIARLRRAVVGLADVVKWLEGTASLPQRPLVLTFDDGYTEHWTVAARELRQRNWPATFFVPANRLGLTSAWEKERPDEPALPLMHAAAVGQLASWGFEVGSHSLSHPHLSRLDSSALVEEIGGSREALLAITRSPVEGFCYPYGDWTPAVRDCVVRAGYRYATATRLGPVRRADDPFTLPRTSPPERTVATEFEAYVIGTIGPWLALRRRLHGYQPRGLAS